MTGTHQGYKFLSRSARTNLPWSLVGQAFLPGLFSQAPASQKGPFRKWLRLECGPHHLREGGFALPEGLQLCFSRSRKCLTARSASARKCEASRRSDRTQPRSELPKEIGRASCRERV